MLSLRFGHKEYYRMLVNMQSKYKRNLLAKLSRGLNQMESNGEQILADFIHWSIVNHSSAVVFLGRFLVGHNVNRNFEYHTNFFDP